MNIKHYFFYLIMSVSILEFVSVGFAEKNIEKFASEGITTQVSARVQASEARLQAVLFGTIYAVF